MVAYADNNKARYFFSINSIQLLTPRNSPNSPINLPPTIYLLVKSDIDENSLRLTIDPSYSVSIYPEDNKTGVNSRLSLALVVNDSLHPHLIQPGSHIFPLPVQSVIFPPFCHHGTISLAGETVKIHYSIIGYT
jgi:hypothetical protein